MIKNMSFWKIIEITNLKELVKKLGSGPQKNNLPAPTRTIVSFILNLNWKKSLLST